MPHRPSRGAIAEADARQLQRQKRFRAAADAVAVRFAAFASVERVALFGSVSRPLLREVPRFNPFRRLRIEILHESKDVDLAVWLSNTNELHDLNRARSKAVITPRDALGFGVAHDQVDIFLLDFATDAYLGRLCIFATCPNDKPACEIAGCGDTPLLRQHAGFSLQTDALDAALVLFDRQRGIRALAIDLPLQPV